MQIGGDVLAATDHSLGAKDVLIGGKSEFKNTVYITGDDNNTDGIVFGSLGTATKGIDFSSSGLSGSTDYLIYEGINNYWAQQGASAAGGLIAAYEFKSTGANLYLHPNNAGYNIILHLNTINAKQALLVGTQDGGLPFATITNATSDGTATLVKTTHGLSLAAGMLAHITDSTTAAAEGFYHVVCL